MRRVRVTLPATAVDFGVGLRSLGLALSLYVTVEISERSDDQIVVETAGEDPGRYPLGWRHPVVIGLSRIFQQREQAVLGLTIRVENGIPHQAGLGAEIALVTAGMIGGNNLLNHPLTRDQLAQMAARTTGRPEHVFAAIHGGLTASILEGETALFRRLPIAPLKVLLVLLDAPGQEDGRVTPPERIPQADALHSLGRLPLLLDALRAGDHSLLAVGMDDRIAAPYHRRAIPLYDDTWDFLRRNGAAAMTPIGGCPALLIFAARDHERLAELLEAYYIDEGLAARVWIAHVDTQGVVVSAAQTG
ncbi:MAG: homoserine kinase [Candidatus Flexifilum sp.]